MQSSTKDAAPADAHAHAGVGADAGTAAAATSPPASSSPAASSAELKTARDQNVDPEAVADALTSPVIYTEEDEKRVVRKLDRNLMPLVWVVLLLASLDRSNIGNAYTAGMGKELKLSSPDYQWLLTIFYIAYILFEVNILLYKFLPPHRVLASVVFLWGLAATLQSAAQNWSGMMALRFILGAAEATAGPGIVYLLSFFYMRHELGLRCGLYFSSAALASCFAGALAYGLTSAKHSALAPWRLLFLVEGVPTLILAPFVWFFLPDSPPTARFLNAEEKRIAASRNVKQAGSEVRVGKIDWKGVLGVLTDIKAWLCALMYFSMNTSYSSLPVYLPTLIQELGYSSINAQGLTAPPYLLAFIVTILSTWSADRTRQRGLHVIALSCIGGIGYLLLATTESVGARYAGVYFAAGGIFPAIANVLPWVMNIQTSDTGRGAGVMLLNLVGQCGPLLGTRLYPATEKPHYTKGHSICAAFLFFNALLALSLRTICWYENKRLDRKYGSVAEIRRRKEEEQAASASAITGSGVKEGESKGAGENRTSGVALENWSEEFRYVL